MTTQSTDERQLEMLKAVADYDRPKLQESVFIKRYLHYFTGQAPVQLATAQWLEVAGSPFAEVDVYNGNEFLFRVPALLASNARTLDGLSNISVYRAAELVGAHYNVHPKLGDSKLHQLITSPIGNEAIRMRGLEANNALIARLGRRIDEQRFALDRTIQRVAHRQTKTDDLADAIRCPNFRVPCGRDGKQYRRRKKASEGPRAQEKLHFDATGPLVFFAQSAFICFSEASNCCRSPA